MTKHNKILVNQPLKDEPATTTAQLLLAMTGPAARPLQYALESEGYQITFIG